MKTIRKLNMLLSLVLLGLNIEAQVPRATMVDWSGTIGGHTNAAGVTETIRLTGDVNLTGNISVHGTLTIDLNGYVMKRNNMNYLVRVQNGGKLIVKDSRPTTKHYGKAENVAGPLNKTYPYLWNYNASYTASTPGAIEIEGGIMTGGIGTIAGCVFVDNGATFELQGGTLAGSFIYCDGGVYDAVEVNAMVRKGENHDEDNFFLKGGFGGGVFVAPTGTMNMTGGRICYNFASVCGGGVHNSGNFIMDNGRIDHNSTISEDYWGGGVYISHDPYYQPAGYGDALGDFTLNGGLIDYNTAASGGGVMVWENANFTMNGGAINYNHAGATNGHTGNGGAVYVQTGTFNFNQGEMRGNSAFRYGGAVNINQTAIFNLNGDCHIYENIADDGGGISQEAGDCVISLTNPGILIEDNVAYNDGGGLFVEKGTLTYSAGIVRNNTAGNNGGGIHIRVKRIAGDVNFNMTGGTVEGNQCGLRNQEDAVTATDYYRSGGGLCITADYPVEEGDSNDVVVNLSTAATFRNNGADGTYGEHGGGLYINVNTENSTAEVNVNTGALFDNNTAKHDGGGFYLNSGSVKVNGGKVNNNNAGRNGGGVFIGGTTSSIVVSNTAEINGNTTQIDGGGFYADGGSVLVNTNSHVDENTATTGRGGGIFSKSGATFDKAFVLNNNAVLGGGFYVASGTSSSIQTLIQNGSNVNSNTANNGAGAYVESGILKVLDNTTQVNSNTATTSGGGIYMASGTVTFTDAKMQSNTATNNDGGGLYLGSGSITISGDNSAITTNSAKIRGGGIYVGGGTFEMTGGAIGGTVAEGNTTGSGGYGGGLFMGGGTATLSNGSISGNKAEGGYGGGVYMEGGSCTLSGGAQIGGANANYANSAKFGGGLYSAGGAITVQGGHIDYNNATADGGGIYSNGPTATVIITKEGTTQSFLQYNTAVNGGGIYANRGSVEFTDGNVDYNYASNNGGGMYVNDEGTLYMKGNAIMSRNHVPEGKDGGGVYLRGTIVVGEQVSNPADLGVLLAEDNYAGDSYQYNDNANNRNNIYLPEPQNPEVLTSHRDVITVIYNGISESSKVGFSVPRNYVPVIYCENNNVPCTEAGYTDYSTSQRFLHKFSTGMELQHNLFDDTERYTAVHYVDKPGIFDPDHVYLYGFWTNIVTTNPVGTDTIGDIDTPEKLAYFISWVNGLNDRKLKGPRPNAYGNITADIDMSAYGWVPIGAVDTVNYADSPGFTGVINGNGHTITGISSLLNGHHKAYGIVGQLKGGEIRDLYVKDAEYALEYVDGLVIGGLAGDVTGDAVIANSEVSCSIMATHPNTIMGGLIGRSGNDNTEPTIHSSIGIADMTGFEMGGLIGRNVKGDLYNSFANAKFTSQNNNDKYMGGLVAVNGGTVENCYSRLRGTAPSGNFGILVGDNTGGTVNYCYAPAGMRNYKAAGDSLTGHGNYGVSELPYLYRHRDTQVTATNDYVPAGDGVDRQMLIALNNWVNEMSTEDLAYTKWGRPWQESDTNKPLNDDYPILKMPIADAVAAKAGDPYLYYSRLDTLLAKYTKADEAIWKYRTATDTVRGANADTTARLYIAEDVMLLNENPLKAYVGITLDNSAGMNGANPTYFDVVDTTDWHLISTPLSNAPIGIDYTTDSLYEFDEGHPSGMPYYRFYLKNNPKHGYFPSHRFGKDYPASDTSIEDGNYYNEWDFYAYYEPKYHWINFKRNSASHHVYGDDDHETINYYGDGVHYGNEARLIPGKGYFAATREETFLQCYGALNNGSVEYNNLTQTTGVPRHGYNLIGNPYQAYLDFNAFAEANSHATMEDAIWYTPEAASYTILDEDELVTNDSVETAVGKSPVFYKTFAYESSSNPDVGAGRFIHPHQGFFVLLRGRSNAAATFEPVMRNVSDTVSSKFRGQDHIDYPLVNLFAIEESGAADVVTVELGRPTPGGAQVMHGLRTGNGKIWCHYNDEDYAIAYTQPGISEVSVRFESAEDTEYTMRWSTRNGEFSYLHLIDNLTGANIDCLSESEYKFSSRTSDYTSRFKLVFGYTGIEEDSEAEATQTFAFMMGDEMVVNGEGELQVFDVNGRMVASRELHGVQSTVALPEVANGVYVLRLTEGRQSRVQKMVISK